VVSPIMSERITETTHLPESEASEALEKEVTTYRILNHLFQVDNEYIRAGDIEGAVSFGKAPKCVVIRHFNCRCAGFGGEAESTVTFTMWLCFGLFGPRVKARQIVLLLSTK
jgi:hypothetical protein